MLNTILEKLASNIYNTGFVSRAYGLAQEVNVSANGISTAVLKGAFAPNFQSGNMETISPDSAYSAITFFRAGATRVTRQNTYLMQCENDVQLYVWLNGNKISSGSAPDTAIINAVWKARIEIESGSPVRSVDVMFSGDAGQQVDVSRWGWDRMEFQYGAMPHRFLQLQFRIAYTLNTGCSDQTIPVVNLVC